jgi:hypothetical protein
LKLPEAAGARLGVVVGALLVVVIVLGVAGVGRGSSKVAPVLVAPRGGDTSLAPYDGLGTWVDVFDFVPAYQRDGVAPTFTADDVDVAAEAGVRTIYLQGARSDDRLSGLVPDDLLGPILARAHARGLKVVGWYLPTLGDVDADLDRLVRLARYSGPEGQRFDGIAVDIEDNQVVTDPAARSQRLIDLSKRLREQLGPDHAIGAIVLPAVLTEVINPQYWPGFPWAQIDPYYDVWLPMAYWSGRKTDSGYHDGYKYAAESVQRMRGLLGDAGAKVHLIGGIADAVTEDEVRGFLRALTDTAAIGGSLYDYRTTPGGIWGILREGMRTALAPVGTTVPGVTVPSAPTTTAAPVTPAS